MMSHRKKLHVLWLIVVLAIVAVYSIDPIAQDPAYHQFADQRYLFLFPNTLDVLSNVFFLLVGVSGLAYLYRHRRTLCREVSCLCYAVYFSGVMLISFGSSYYHWQPDNLSLAWDRLPMSIAFMGLFATVIAELVDRQSGERWLLPLLLIGVGSVLYWGWSEQQGRGDLRLYALVQFLPMLLIPLMILMFRNPPHYRRYMVYVIVFYALSKLCELLDNPIFTSSGVISGHSLKHLCAAIATGFILLMLRQRHRAMYQHDH